ncbi:MAG: amidase [Burkholderiaceae bacterium]|nr:amidase [Burkholderiaceae bacterium]
MSDLAFLPAHELARRIRRKQVSASELLALYLDRIARLGGPINAVPVLDAERAHARARAADAALARGELWGPLHGVPMTVKESFNVTGLPTTYGFTAYANNIATGDALTVQRLLGAGAVIFGKTNVPVSLADWQSFNPVYGTTANPWDTTRTPGGSSGGSAAALAAGFTALELGSDIGASIRNPAHYCGVWGHKPTWGVVPMAGHELTPAVRADDFDIAAVGPLARSAFDLALAMDILASPLEAMTPLGRLPAAWRDRGTPPRRLRIAVLYDDAQAEVDASVQRALRDLVAFLRDQGVVVAEDARPVDSAEANAVYTHLLRAATGSQYDDAAHAEAVARSRDYAVDDARYPARHFRGIASSHRDWVAMHERRVRLQQRWAAFFEQHDLLVCPVATTPAFPHLQTGERWDRMIPVNGHTQPSTDALFWAGYPGIVGLPATAIPLGLSPEGLPVGAQVIGPVFADPDCLRFAQWIEREYRAFVPPPALAGTPR